MTFEGYLITALLELLSTSYSIEILGEHLHKGFLLFGTRMPEWLGPVVWVEKRPPTPLFGEAVGQWQPILHK